MIIISNQKNDTLNELKIRKKKYFLLDDAVIFGSSF